MGYRCLDGNSAEVKKRFLSLPVCVCEKEFFVQDKKTEQQILEGRHVLSGDFEVYPFIVTDDDGKTICRCLMTYYPDDDNAYAGFFESYDDYDAVKLMMDCLFRKAEADGKKSIIGPLDASFWIKYRFKTNYFDRIYTSEPYNPEYYPKLWEKYGFEVMCHYSSNQGRVPLKEDTDLKCIKRYEKIRSEGYEIRNPDRRSFTDDLRKVYRLLVKIYSSFPGFRFIDEEKFMIMFGKLKYILNYEMVLLAFRDGELAGFSVNIPDYQNAAQGIITPGKLVRIFRRRKSPDQYILLYMGVSPGHYGLGGALGETAKKYLQEHGQKYIGALIMDGKATNIYYDQLHYAKYEYVLMKKEIN